MVRVVGAGRDPEEHADRVGDEPAGAARGDASMIVEDALSLMVVHGYRHLLVEDRRKDRRHRLAARFHGVDGRSRRADRARGARGGHPRPRRGHAAGGRGHEAGDPSGAVTAPPAVRWTEAGAPRSARWRSESGATPPGRVVVADDRITADAAYRLACTGTAMLWRGDFQNARQLLNALARRAERKPFRPGATPAETFHRYRQAQAQRAHTLGMLLLPFDADHGVPLRRAPDVRQACAEAWGPGREPCVASLRALLGIIGAHEWRKNGVAVPALGDRVHPHYGVFAPIRGEYVDLVAQAPLPSQALAFDVGTGNRRPRRRACPARRRARRGHRPGSPCARLRARESRPARPRGAGRGGRRGSLPRRTRAARRLQPAVDSGAAVLADGARDLRPRGPDAAPIPGRARRASRAGRRGLARALGLAEHLGLRSRAELLAAFDAAGLEVVGRLDARPQHPRAADAADPLHAARAAEVTSLWRLAAR